MPTRLNQIPDVLTPSLVIVIFIMTALVPVPWCGESVENFSCISLSYSRGSSQNAAWCKPCNTNSDVTAIPCKGLLKSLIFLQDC